MSTELIPDEFINRFWTQVNKTGLNGCWEWTGPVDFAGYGFVNQYAPKRKYWFSHRLAFSLINGPIAKGLNCCHKCDNRKCVNPDHIFLGTHKDNYDDQVKKGRARFQNPKPQRTHCKKGHELSPDNTVFNKGRAAGICRMCFKLYKQNYWIAKRDRLREEKINGASKTPVIKKCKRGHEMNDENMKYIHRAKHRMCILCIPIRRRDAKLRKRLMQSTSLFPSPSDAKGKV